MDPLALLGLLERSTFVGTEKAVLSQVLQDSLYMNPIQHTTVSSGATVHLRHSH
jgi:hypothetical protein